MAAPVYTIRDAVVTDMPAIMGLIHELAEYEKAPLEVENTVAQLTADFLLQRFFAFVAVDVASGRVLSFALCFYTYSTWQGTCVYLEDLYVEPGSRHLGIGMNMFRVLVSFAKQQQCARVNWSALDWNTPALNFYTKLGATTLNEWKLLRLTTPSIDTFIQTFGTYENPITVA